MNSVAIGTAVPWRDVGNAGRASSSPPKAYARDDGEEDPRAQLRTVSPGFFGTLSVPLVAGRDFNEADRRGAEPVVIVSESVAQPHVSRIRKSSIAG